MRWREVCLVSFMGLALAGCSDGGRVQAAADQSKIYVPRAQYCAPSPSGPVTGSPLCSKIPGNIGPDPALDVTIAYNGIVGGRPPSAARDPQTPFDNLSWQTFVALNWTKGKENRPAQEGLRASGPRVWEGWPRVSQVFGDSPVRAACTVPPGLAVFQIASDGNGHPVAQNEEYIQAATGDPAIDVSGNWTIYERRLNGVEVAYLKAPGGNTRWNLTTTAGQQAFVSGGGVVNFPAAGGPNLTGAIEIKAAWRVLDPARRAANQRKFYVVPAMLTVAPDLVAPLPGRPSAPICAAVDLGLVAMHIIQKNPLTKNSLKPEWFWSTFEHVDNAPLAAQACDPASPATCALLGSLECPAKPQPIDYSYFKRSCPDCKTNQPPAPAGSGTAFAWNPTQPYAKGYAPTQVSRCWKLYALTDELNSQWRGQLAKVGSVFQNYMLVGTQWGASITSTPDPKIPGGAVPNFLSNTIVETYLQTLADPNDAFATGSCVTCHREARLPVSPNPSSNLSFLPDLATPGLTRRAPMGTRR